MCTLNCLLKKFENQKRIRLDFDPLRTSCCIRKPDIEAECAGCEQAGRAGGQGHLRPQREHEGSAPAGEP